jgi:SAM-dependent methyltransferase
MAEHDNWDSHWEKYDAAARRNPAQQMRHEIILKLLRLDTGAVPARLLDLGSGQGDFLVKLHAAFPSVELLGFELSASGVEISRRKLPSARFVVADLFHPPENLAGFPEGATHAVCSEVLEHVDSPELFLRAARPYLAANAQLVVTVPGGPMSAFDRHIGHRRHFNRESIRAVLTAAGFATDRVYLSGFPFFNCYRGLVIARGEGLAADVETNRGGFAARVAGVAMDLFRPLFRLNLLDSPFGWQVVAVARKLPD